MYVLMFGYTFTHYTMHTILWAFIPILITLIVFNVFTFDVFVALHSPHWELLTFI